VGRESGCGGCSSIQPIPQGSGLRLPEDVRGVAMLAIDERLGLRITVGGDEAPSVDGRL